MKKKISPGMALLAAGAFLFAVVSFFYGDIFLAVLSGFVAVVATSRCWRNEPFTKEEKKRLKNPRFIA